MANGPGGLEIGRVSIRVVPDTSQFRRDAERELKKAVEGLEVSVKVVLDTTGIKAEFDKIKEEMDGDSVELDVEVDADGVTREVRRIRKIAQALVGAIKLTAAVNIPASVARIRADLAVIQKLVRGYSIHIPVDLVSWTKLLGILGLISGALLAMPHLIGAIGGAAMVLTGAFAVLPALLAGAAAGIATLVVGMKGFFSALSASGDAEKFEEALKGLTPAAQDAARALATFKEPLSEIRKSVQEELFKGMKEPFLELKKLLPPIKAGMTGIAGGIRDMTKSWIKMATSQQSVKDTGTILDNIKKGFQGAEPAAANFGKAMRDITVVGSTFLPQLGESLSNVTQKFADWAEKARATGRLQEIIQNTVDKLQQFGRVIADLVVGMRNLWEGLGNGKDFLDIVEGITQAFRDWSELDSTTDTLKRIGQVLRTVATTAAEVFKKAFKAIGEIFREIQPFLETFIRLLGTVLIGIIEFLTPLFKELAKWLSENKEVASALAITILAMVTAFKLVSTAVNAVEKLWEAFKVLKAATRIIGEIIISVGRMVVTMFQLAGQAFAAAGRFVVAWATIGASAVKQAAITSAAWVASAIKSAAFTGRYYAIMAGQAIKNFLKISAAAVLHATRTATVWIAQTLRAVGVVVAQVLFAAGVWVAQWLRMAAVALAQAARMALAWIIAMGPIGILIAAIIALVVLIVMNWDTIVAATRAAWDWVWKIVSDVITAIVTGFKAFVQFFVDLWNWLWKTVTDIITGGANTMGGIIDSIIGFFHRIGDFVGTFIGWFQHLKDGAVGKFIELKNWIAGLPGAIYNIFKDNVGKMISAGGDMIRGLVKGLSNAAGAVWNYIKKICSDVLEGIKNFFGIASPSKVMAEVGGFVMQGLTVGMEKHGADAVAASAAVSKGIVGAFGDSMEIGKTIADGVAGSIPEAVKTMDQFTKATLAQADQNFNANLSSEGVEPIADQLAGALSGIQVNMDSKPVGKILARNNTMNARRG